MIGRTISHYEILEKLGEGGMGVVYKARDTKLERTVAIKFLPTHLSADKEARKRFIQEAKSASAIDHQHICTIHEIDETGDGSTFIVMAFYEGETLRERIDRGGMTTGEALDIASQIAAGLAKAHGRDIVHRDIKPQNILITGEGVVKIIDFGLAKLAGRTKLTREGSTIGTAAYMSPEQARGEEVDHRSDIFSLGTIFYEMLAGGPPFRGEHEAALLYGIVHEEPGPLPDEVTASYPGLQGLVNRALVKDPAGRYQDMDELQSVLLRVKGDTSQGSAASGSPVGVPETSGWKRAYTYIGIVSVAAVILFAVYFFILRDQYHTERRSIAVLPFKSIVTEPGYEWFGDGMTEAIIGHLTKIKGLKVTSSTSAMKFKDTDMTLGEIADELGVATVLEGNVQQTGGRVHLMVKLIDARTDEHLWVEEYERSLEDVFAVQTDVALNVVDQLRATLTPEVEARIEARPTNNIEAYKLLMKGSAAWSKETHEDRLEAIESYKKAIDKDPEYAEAYVRLAYSYLLITVYGYESPKEMIPRAKKYALKALELDIDNISAYNLLAMIDGPFLWNWEESERRWRKVIELNPGNAEARSGYAWYLILRGRFDEAVAEQRKAIELDPLSVRLQQNEGEILYYARRYDESIEASKRAIKMNPNYAQSNMFIGFAYIGKGMKEEAVAALEYEQSMSGGMTPEVENWIGTAFAMAGEYDKARAVLEHLFELSRENWVSPFVIAILHVALGEEDQGFVWLEKAYEEHDSRMPFLNIHPAWDRVRSDPRYIDMLARIGLAD